MRKLFLFFIFAILLTSFALAVRYEDNYMRYGTIDSGGNLHETSTPVNNVNIRGYVCSNSACSSVSGNLWGGGVLSTSGDFIQLTYPTSLLSPFGYGVYFYKEGYIPYEVSANWWGTCSSCDPEGPFYDFLTKKEVCFSNINSLQTIVSPGNINVNVSVHSPIDHAGPLTYVPSALNSHYSASVSVNLEAVKNGSVVYSENKSVLIPFSGNSNVQFNVPVSSAGNYNIQVYTTTNDLKCLNYSSDYENKTKIINCTEDFDCGLGSWLTRRCEGDDVFQDYGNVKCFNPGLESSYCGQVTNTSFVEDCGTDSYSDYSANYCIGDDVYRNRTFYDRGCLIDSCFDNSIVQVENVENCSAGCSNGECNIACHNDSECGGNYCLAGNNTCSGLNIYRNTINFVCNNPNTVSSYCSNFTSPLLIGSCNYNCSLGRCIGS